jgi:RNA polymerase sigma factor (sigma-70 family)
MAAIQPLKLPFELRCVVESVGETPAPHDQQWILGLIQAQGRLVVSLLWRMLGSEQDALDAYQSTICRLIAQGQEAIGTNRAGYFYRAAMNAGIEMLRMRQRRQRHWPAMRDTCSRRSAEKTLDLEPNNFEDLDALRTAISKLPPHLRDVIVLREMAGLPYRQVSAILNIGLATARLYRRQAVLRLADLLRREGIAVPDRASLAG